MTPRLTAVALALAIGLAGCGSSTSAPMSNAPSTAASPYVVPAKIDAAYVNRVFAALVHVRGEALRDSAGRSGALPTADADRLKSIYADVALDDQTQAFTQLAAAPANPEMRNPPGDEVITASAVIAATPTTITVRAAVDNSSITKVAEPNTTPWIIQLTKSAPSGSNPTPWKLSFGAQENATTDLPNANLLSQWNETALGVATASTRPLIGATSDSIVVTQTTDAVAEPLETTSTTAVSITSAKPTAATPVTNVAPPVTASLAPAAPSAKLAIPIPKAIPATTTTTEDPAVSAAKVKAYAQQMWAATKLPVPDPQVRLNGGTFAQEDHQLALDFAPYVENKQTATPYGNATLTILGTVTVGWGDGTNNVYRYADYNWANTPMHHVWTSPGTYDINVTIIWTPSYVIGPYNGVVRSGTLDAKSTTGKYAGLPLTYPY